VWHNRCGIQPLLSDTTAYDLLVSVGFIGIPNSAPSSYVASEFPNVVLIRTPQAPCLRAFQADLPLGFHFAAF
jgi:hypothetical protein